MGVLLCTGTRRVLHTQILLFSAAIRSLECPTLGQGPIVNGRESCANV